MSGGEPVIAREGKADTSRKKKFTTPLATTLTVRLLR